MEKRIFSIGIHFQTRDLPFQMPLNIVHRTVYLDGFKADPPDSGNLPDNLLRTLSRILMML